MKRLACFVAVAALGVCCAWGQQTGPGATSKVSKEAKNADPNSNVDVIVQYQVQPTDVHFDRAHALGGIDKRTFTRIPHAAYTIPASSLQALANDPDVKSISLDHKIKAHLNITAALSVQTWFGSWAIRERESELP